MEIDLYNTRKVSRFTETWLTRQVCRASGRYLRGLYDCPQDLRNDFEGRGLRVPTWDTANKWLSGQDAPPLKRAGCIMASGLHGYFRAIEDALLLATDEERRTAQKAEALARYEREINEIEAIEALDIASRVRTGVARGDDPSRVNQTLYRRRKTDRQGGAVGVSAASGFKDNGS